MNESKFIRVLSIVASIIAVCMYVSYIPQIQNNLNGAYCAPLQPFVAGVNCTLWSIYAYFKKERDWAIFVANFPGVIFGFITFFTALH
ncbi:MAG: SemiSWEET family transporter [Limosilactobacillus sp.]|uniref:SemiSWEET family transporter n=1 Tax=Limosilactobacillus sp. TaxID=2773925 RepID=UPI00270289BF|nr:SemiSWEET family transporter [Limosilactobacillus sp.]